MTSDGLAGVRVLVATESTADDRKVLATVEALGRAGARVTLGSDRHEQRSSSSPAVAGRVTYPSPVDDEDAFLTEVEAWLRRERQDVLLPLSDHTTFPVSRSQDRLADVVGLAVPTFATLDHVHDKAWLMSRATDLGIAVPRTVEVERRVDLRAAAAEIGYPCVVKPRRGAAGVGFRVVHGPSDLDGVWPAGRSDRVVDLTRLLVQEHLAGEVHDVGVVCEHGAVAVALTQRRARMHPPEGGPGYEVEITDEPALLAIAERLLGHLGWHGPAQVELRFDGGGAPRLLEVNGRFWGTVGAAIDAGVDIPGAVCRLALGRPVPASSGHRVGLVVRWPLPGGDAGA